MKEKFILQIGLLCVFIILTVALYHIQIINGKSFAEIAEKNYVRIQKIDPVRGEILDVKYTPIVKNEPAYNLYMIPGKIKSKEDLISFLNKNLGISQDEIKKIIYDNRFRTFSHILVKEDLDYKTIVKISEEMHRFPSLLIKTESIRRYLSKNHFTGYVGRINDSEYAKLSEKGYSRNDLLGKNGLEKKYEDVLRGEPGYNIIQIDARGKSLDLFKHHFRRETKNGADLILSINMKLQEFVYKIFPKNAKGAIVVMDTRSGGILAYLSMPVYDQNLFIGGISQKDWNEIVNNPQKPMLDRVIHGTYPPASIFKPISVGLGIDYGIVTPEEKLSFCDGGLQIGNRYFKCWSSYGHGRTNAVEALKYSCDVYFYDLSQKIDLELMKSYTKKCFLTVKTGIDLLNEKSGFFPDEAWYRKNYGKYVGIIGPKANISIGQGELLVTPIQMCAYYNALANRGVWKQPYLVESILDEDNQYILPKHKTLELPHSQESINTIIEGLYETVNGKWGTGGKAKSDFDEIKSYGKTGSAENHINDTTHAWFAGFAEWEEPEISFVIFLENQGHGGSVAAPLAKEIIEFYHKYCRED